MTHLRSGMLSLQPRHAAPDRWEMKGEGGGWEKVGVKTEEKEKLRGSAGPERGREGTTHRRTDR